MRPTVFILISLFYCNVLYAQCNRTVKVLFTGINYKANCDFIDGGGIDPKLDLFNDLGTRIYNSHYGDQAQVTGPQDNVPIDFNITVNPCGNFSNSFTLGTFPLEMETMEVRADLYEKDSNFINDQCNPYNPLFDDNYSTGVHVFDFTQPTGLLDVGGCMTYNYELQISFAGNLTINFLSTLCPSDTLYVANTAYHLDNPTANFMVPGLPNTCDTIYNIDLIFHNPIVLDLEGPQIICPGDTAILQLNALFDNYLWNDGTTADSLKIDTAGTYMVTVTSMNGCTETGVIDIVEYGSPSYEIVGETNFCTGDSIELSLSNPPISQVWSNGMDSATITISEGGSYGVTITDANGCSSSNEIMVREDLAPSPLLEGPDSFCQGDTINLTLDQEYESYSWADGNDQKSIQVSAEGSYTVTVTDTNGCTATAQSIITFSMPPSPNIIGSAIVCQGMGIDLAVSQDYDSYVWNTGETTKEIFVTSDDTYTVTVTDLNGCSASAMKAITTADQINCEIVGEVVICEGQTHTLSVGDIGVEVDYLWHDGATEQERIASTAGDYSVTITDTNGCTGNATVTIEVIPQIVEERDSLTCFSDQVGIITLREENSSGCQDLIRYTIRLDEEQRCDIDYSWTTNAATCQDLMDGMVLLSLMDAQYPIYLELSNDTGEILFSDSIKANIIDFIIPDLSVGDYVLKMTANNELVEEEEVEILLQENAAPVVQDSYSITEGEEIELIAILDTSIMETYYWALDNTPLCPENCQNAIVQPSSSTTYTFFSRRSDNNCEYLSYTEVIIRPDQNIYIPNIFASEDGSIDKKFEISGPGVIYITDLRFYDRWGNLIHQTDGTDPTWDGTANGTVLGPGVYIYVIENQDGPDNKLKSYKTGSITLIR